MSSTEKEITVFIRDWVYRLCGSDSLTVFIGSEALFDEKQALYRACEVEYKFVSDNIPQLGDARLGDLFRIRVKEEHSPQYGYQWQVVSAERIESALIHEIRSFLTKIGGRCLTNKRRDTLIETYDAKVFETILTNPSVLDVIKPTLNTNSKNRIYRAIADHRGFADLLTFLEKQKWDCRWAIPLYELYRDEAILQLRADPYLLYKHGFASFKAADRVFLDAGGAVNIPRRCWNAVLAALRAEEEQNGGVLIPRKELRKKIAALLWDTTKSNSKVPDCTISEDDISKALDWLEDCKRIYIDRADGREDVYFSRLYLAEVQAVERLKVLCQVRKAVACPPDQIDCFLAAYRTPNGLQLTKAQRMAVKQMLTAPVSVITGGPGTGKTLIVKAAIDTLRELYPQAVVQCCAPTGKAADRMPAEACTIDRLVESEKWKRVNRTGKRDPDIFFVDEVSMLGIELFAKLLTIVPVGARLVLIGDQNQLPSIAAGQVLRDLIDSGVIRTVQLQEVFRQQADSAISSNAGKIIHMAVDQDIHLDDKGTGFAFNKSVCNPHRIPYAVIQAIELVLEAGLPLKDIQVIVRQRSGELGVRNLNHLLQNHFNPQQKENKLYYGGKEFRLHDRVIHTKNNYDLNVFNGEVGVITEIYRTKERTLVVQYSSRTVEYAEKDLEELELAYALTAHKCQGSEYRAVIIPVAGKGISRKWLYTAVTRGKQLVLLIGTEAALTVEMREESTDIRASRLACHLKKFLPPILPEVEQISMFPPTQK